MDPSSLPPLIRKKYSPWVSGSDWTDGTQKYTPYPIPTKTTPPAHPAYQGNCWSHTWPTQKDKVYVYVRNTVEYNIIRQTCLDNFNNINIVGKYSDKGDRSHIYLTLSSSARQIDVWVIKDRSEDTDFKRIYKEFVEDLSEASKEKIKPVI